MPFFFLCVKGVDRDGAVQGLVAAGTHGEDLPEGGAPGEKLGGSECCFRIRNCYHGVFSFLTRTNSYQSCRVSEYPFTTVPVWGSHSTVNFANALIEHNSIMPIIRLHNFFISFAPSFCSVYKLVYLLTYFRKLSKAFAASTFEASMPWVICFSVTRVGRVTPPNAMKLYIMMASSTMISPFPS